MGTEYAIACKTCNTHREVDKLQGFTTGVMGRVDALRLCADIQRDGGLAYRLGLLFSFLYEHQGHECVLTNDVEFDYPEDGGSVDDGIDFWSDPAREDERYVK